MREQQTLQLIWRLTVLLCVSEIGYGMWAGSLGLISDGVHSFANCLGVGTSLFAMRYASKSHGKSTTTISGPFSYGLADRAEVLAAFANSVILMLLATFLVSEALHGALSEHSHHADHGDHVAFVAVSGVILNALGLHLLSPHLNNNLGVLLTQVLYNRPAPISTSPRLLNLEAVALHLMFDIVSSLSVLASAILARSADGLMAVGIALLTVRSVQPMFQRTLRILAQASQVQYDDKLRELAASVDGILEFYQVHFWTLGPSKEVGSFIVRIRNDADADEILKQAHRMFAAKLWSLTVQIQREKSVLGAGTSATSLYRNAQHLHDEDGLVHHMEEEEDAGLAVRDAAHII